MHQYEVCICGNYRIEEIDVFESAYDAFKAIVDSLVCHVFVYGEDKSQYIVRKDGNIFLTFKPCKTDDFHMLYARSLAYNVYIISDGHAIQNTNITVVPNADMWDQPKKTKVECDDEIELEWN